MKRLFAILALCTALLGCAVVGNAVDRTTMEVQGTALFMAGEITSRTPANFERLLAENPQVRTIVLTNMSGSLDDGAVQRMGYHLRNAGMNTRLTAQSEIYSGAVDLFLAGSRRSMAPGAVIGVHAWADGFGAAGDYPPDAPEHQALVQYTRNMLGSDSFYWFTLQAAPPSGIHIMSAAEIAHFGLLTE